MIGDGVTYQISQLFARCIDIGPTHIISSMYERKQCLFVLLVNGNPRSEDHVSHTLQHMVSLSYPDQITLRVRGRCMRQQ